MAAASSSRPKPFLDLQKVVTEWAWGKYDEKPTKKQKNLRDKENRKKTPYIGVDIDWSDCKFVDGEPDWPDLVESKGDDTKKKTSKVASSSGRDVSVLFETEFTNNTNSEQQYSMQINKITKSTCTTEISNGVTQGFEMNIGLKLPSEVLEMNAGYHREVTLTNTSGETFEEELSWGTESPIRVEKKSVAHAQLVVKESRKEGAFSLTSTVNGYVKVTFTNLRDNNSFLRQAYGDISYIVQKYLDKQQRLDNIYPHVKIDDGTVTIVTNGKCKFRYGVKQEVVVNQRPI